MLKFKDYDIPGAPVIIKKECSNAENVDENATKCTESKEIANIKCEEIHIKDELDNGVEQSGSYQMDDYDNLGENGSSKKKGKVKKYKPGEKEYFCPKCPHSTHNKYRLKTHMRTHLENKQHCCTFCSFVTDARLLLRAHLTSHKGATKRYGCCECSYETDNKTHLEEHILKHKDVSEVEMHKCLLCPFKCKYKSNLAQHHKVQHDKNRQTYKCQECAFSTRYRRSFANHHVMHEDPKVANKFKCEKCSYCTKWQGDLRKHMKCHLPKHTDSCQGKTHTNPSEVPKFQCAHCPYETAEKPCLSSHIRARHYSKDQRPFKCDLCRFGTWDESQLELHQLTHMELGEAIWHYCFTCDFKTIYKYNLIAHIKICVKKKRIKDTDDEKN